MRQVGHWEAGGTLSGRWGIVRQVGHCEAGGTL